MGIPVILKSLRAKDADIIRIVTVADDGGSSARFVRPYRLPPGDLKCVVKCQIRLGFMKDFSVSICRIGRSLGWSSSGKFDYRGISEMQGSTYNAMRLLDTFFIRLVGSIHLVRKP